MSARKGRPRRAPAADDAVAGPTIDPDEAGCRLLLSAPAGLDTALVAEGLLPGVAALVLDGGDDAIDAHAAALQALCRARTSALLLDGDAARALALGVDGAVIGGGARWIAAARAVLGPDRILAAAVPPSRHEAMEAGEAGADLVLLRPRSAADTASLADLVAWWAEMCVLPIAAPDPGPDTGADSGPDGGPDGDMTGGARRAALLRAGLDFLAVGPDIWQHPEGVARAVEARLRAIAALRPSGRPRT